MGGGRPSDRGQAFPIYVVVVTGLLFAAFAFFAVGQASVRRSDAQGAADAAALAAAGKARDGALADLDLITLKPEDWQELLSGKLLTGKGACAAASDFAARNDATVGCEPSTPRFTVTVRTNQPVGKSVVPGTEGMYATASATALIEPRCVLGAGSTSTPTLPPDGGSGPKPTASAPAPDTIKLRCKGGKPIRVDPLNPGSLRALSRSLFSVRLVD